MSTDTKHEYATPTGAEVPASPGTAPSFVWSDARVLGYGPMDDRHREFYLVAFDLLTCDEDNALRALSAFEKHAVEHFSEEEGWMHSTAFPPRDCHIDEHAAVLASVREVREGVAQRRFGAETVHDLAQHLFQWFPGHADYLDSALAAWMTKRKMGGKPVVLRRSLSN
ncbi:bacteriohemerythrin [Pelomonas sp. KK5]|uniref:bacteriohemerythrin n=1 Tax=Pelomonas sp. KK5 TaxID=1855730 RepID=UPI00097CB704|nr:hemerythrin domain-containing protein [Pelomonas sp. KK5]